MSLVEMKTMLRKISLAVTLLLSGAVGGCAEPGASSETETETASAGTITLLKADPQLGIEGEYRLGDQVVSFFTSSADVESSDSASPVRSVVAMFVDEARGIQAAFQEGDLVVLDLEEQEGAELSPLARREARQAASELFALAGAALSTADLEVADTFAADVDVLNQLAVAARDRDPRIDGSAEAAQGDGTTGTTSDALTPKAADCTVTAPQITRVDAHRRRSFATASCSKSIQLVLRLCTYRRQVGEKRYRNIRCDNSFRGFRPPEVRRARVAATWPCGSPGTRYQAYTVPSVRTGVFFGTRGKVDGLSRYVTYTCGR
jgi:hypothetical protein